MHNGIQVLAAKGEKTLDKNIKSSILEVMAKLQMSNAFVDDYNIRLIVNATRVYKHRIKLLSLNSQQLSQLKEIETDTRKVFHVIIGPNKKYIKGKQTYYELYLIWCSDSSDDWITDRNDVFQFPVYYRFDGLEDWGEYTFVNVMPYKGGLIGL